MNYKILYNLWRTKESATPSRQFKRALWQKLEQDFSLAPKINSAPVWLKWSLIGVASLLIVASFGTGVYAYNSSEVTEGTFLYPIKQKLEQAEEVVKTAPEVQAQFLIKKIARREAEKIVMEKRGQATEKLDRRIEKTIEQLEKADEILQKMEVKQELKNKKIRPQVQAVLEKRLEMKIDKTINKINSQIVPGKKQKSRVDH